ncbi:Arc family DNA-binding protein [Hyphomicrobium sp.]|uniref:Arc family DNA-binding protein n=1 Tax=Hyphomicrobium sp. TaxID=82 RepID=UPI000FC2BF08|nr:MAG: Arc family DNA-binding protein [Hyphomicrobium sp.]
MVRLKLPRKREGDQILLRFPEGSDLRSKLQTAAEKDGRTTTAEIVHRLEQSLERTGSPDDVLEVVLRIERQLQKLISASEPRR